MREVRVWRSCEREVQRELEQGREEEVKRNGDEEREGKDGTGEYPETHLELGERQNNEYGDALVG